MNLQNWEQALWETALQDAEYRAIWTEIQAAEAALEAVFGKLSGEEQAQLLYYVHLYRRLDAHLLSLAMGLAEERED